MVNILILILIIFIVIILTTILFYLIKIKKLTEELMLNVITLSNIIYKSLSEPKKLETVEQDEQKPEETIDNQIGSVFSIVDDLLSGKTNMDEVNNNES